MAINWNTTENTNFYTVIPSYSTVTALMRQYKQFDNQEGGQQKHKKDFYKSEDFYGPAQAAGVPLV